jgi:hypothetical protein
MELNDDARAALAHLTMAPDAYLLGKRVDDGTPFSLIDRAAIAKSKTDSIPLVSREAVRQLFDGGYLQDETGGEESINVGFVLSEKARAYFAAASGRPERVTLSFVPGDDYEAARAAVLELNGALTMAGGDVSILLQESGDLSAASPVFGFSFRWLGRAPTRRSVSCVHQAKSSDDQNDEGQWNRNFHRRLGRIGSGPAASQINYCLIRKSRHLMVK